MGSRSLKPLPRAKPSGLPFHAHFVNARLTAPTIYGDVIFITCWGQYLLFHNNGDGTFTEVTEKTGLTRAGLSQPRNPLAQRRNRTHTPRFAADRLVIVHEGSGVVRSERFPAR